jgi:hypothetical protein
VNQNNHRITESALMAYQIYTDEILAVENPTFEREPTWSTAIFQHAGNDVYILAKLIAWALHSIKKTVGLKVQRILLLSHNYPYTANPEGGRAECRRILSEEDSPD